MIPCLAAPDKIRFTARFDRDVSSLFPYVNSVTPGAIYCQGGASLTLHKFGSLVTLYPEQVVAARIDDLSAAQSIISWVLTLLNDCHQRRGMIIPNYQRRSPLNVIDVLKLLPRTNCRRCGYLTCLAFAVQITFERASVLVCAELFTASRQDQRRELLSLLRSTGYAIPDVF